MTKITLENENGAYSIEIQGEGLLIDTMFEDLIIPMLLAGGYSPDAINRYIGDA